MESTTRRIVLISVLLIIALAVFLTMNYLHTERREYYTLKQKDILMLKAKAAQARKDGFTNRNEHFEESDLEDAIRAAI